MKRLITRLLLYTITFSIISPASIIYAANIQTEDKNLIGSILEEAIKTNHVYTGHSQIGYKKSKENQEKIKSTETWSATDYENEDIISKNYEVQLGDTLWEIAEAFYGDGFQWHQIIDKNIDKVGFLQNGEQSLIFPGDILNL